MTKTFIWVGMFAGSTLGGFIPLMWGDGIFSFAGMIGSFFGAIAGLIGGYTLAQRV
jgi:outer membrane lipoprotein SlyB